MRISWHVNKEDEGNYLRRECGCGGKQREIKGEERRDNLAGYDFTRYYKEAYLQEKRKNIQLAADTAAKEQAVLELRQKYGRIAGNPVIRCFSGVKKLPEKWKVRKRIKINDMICQADSVSVKQYERELQFQKNPYALWMSEQENSVRQEKGKECLQTEIVYMERCGKDFCLDAVKKPYVLFVSEKGTRSPQAESYVEQFFEKHEKAAIVYAGEDRLGTDETGETVRENPWFKPAYSPETLLSFFYFGNLFAVRTETVKGIQWRKAENWKENIYDFVLKAEESFGESAGERIAFLDAVLFHQSAETEKNKETFVIDKDGITGLWGYEKNFADIKSEALKRRNLSGKTEESSVPGVYSVCIGVKDKISIVILSKDNPKVLEQCIRSIRKKTNYTNYEIIVVDNGSYESNRLQAERLSAAYHFTYLCEPMEFNFSAMCNIGAKHATGRYLLLLNDDVEIIEGNWLKRLAGQASVPGAGAVGAKLWYPDSIQIQHAGITNLAIGPAHKLTGCEDDRMYYDGRNYFTFNCLAVTGACLMIRKELYEEMGGMDETMPVAYNDVEFCFRLHKAGYRNILRNDCILLHHESLSRGLDEESVGKAKRLLEERKRLYRKYPFYEGTDPYYSPWLTQDSAAYVCGKRVRTEETGRQASENNAGKRGKLLHEKELAANIEQVRVAAGKAQVRGWAVLLGADNCHYKRLLLLEGTGNKRVYTAGLLPEYRVDVEAVYPQEIRIGLAGAVGEFSVKNMEKGSYRIGILYEDMLSDSRYYRMFDTYLEIS